MCRGGWVGAERGRVITDALANPQVRVRERVRVIDVGWWVNLGFVEGVFSHVGKKFIKFFCFCFFVAECMCGGVVLFIWDNIFYYFPCGRWVVFTVTKLVVVIFMLCLIYKVFNFLF